MTEQEWLDQTKTLLDFLATQHKINTQDRIKLFELHNYYSVKRERNTGCGACVSRVLGQLKTMYETRLTNSLLRE